MRAAVCVLGCLFAATSFADSVICQGHLRNQSIDRNVVVHQKCILDNVKIAGNIDVKAQGSLTLKRSQVAGNVHAGDDFGGLNLVENHIQGNLEIFSGHKAELIRNQVAGAIDIQNNIGKLVLKHNQSESLSCIHNRIAPIGSHNDATHKHEQCRDL